MHRPHRSLALQLIPNAQWAGLRVHGGGSKPSGPAPNSPFLRVIGLATEGGASGRAPERTSSWFVGQSLWFKCYVSGQQNRSAPRRPDLEAARPRTFAQNSKFYMFWSHQPTFRGRRIPHLGHGGAGAHPKQLQGNVLWAKGARGEHHNRTQNCPGPGNDSRTFLLCGACAHQGVAAPAAPQLW